MRDVLLVLAVFAACVVESVEALTIVLAVGVTRGWQATMRGVIAGLLVLALIVAALGPALTVIPINALRLVVGGLLLVFGLGWLRKAILRASGFKALHDEDAIYARQRAAAQSAEPTGRSLLGDPYAFTLAFKGVLLEGLEVAFIVLTFGANQHNIPLAALGAAIAVVLVTAVGLAIRAPLARVPENTLKFAVGVLLTSFGMFWGVEGAGAHWPGADAALLVLVVGTLAGALAAVAWLRRIGSDRARRAAAEAPPTSAVASQP
ncbi:MAG: COG4280 domain-containing protein [Jatrophihabitans sp.]